jgi:DNA-directed RNA polymerase specialized sigma24 family protein
MKREEPIPEVATETFERHRPLLFSIAYRMLGSMMEAEDVVQEAFLSWQEASGGEIRVPKSYLSTVVTRHSIDRLRSESPPRGVRRTLAPRASRDRRGFRRS